MRYLDDIDGLGPKSKELLEKLNIYSVNDLISYCPRKYNVIRRTNMDNIEDKTKVIIDGLVENQPTIINLANGLKKIIFRISNKKNIYNISAYNKVYLINELKGGAEVTIIGKYNKLKNTIVASEVRIGLLPEKVKIEPVYQLTNGINTRMINKFINNVLDSDYVIEDSIPSTFSDKYNFMSKENAIMQIHNPSDIVSYKRAVQRLKYEELFVYLFKIKYLKACVKKNEMAITRVFDNKLVDNFIDNLGYGLTSDQLSAVSDIKADLTATKRMNRLVQGDVGSGKTIVAMIACYINYLSGYQTALMVPTEILAKQHYEDALKLFKNTDMKICLLTSSVKKSEKNKLYKQIKEGTIDFIIGTQSLIQEELTYNNLGLIITDEQHRFGVRQREILKDKGEYPDILSLSATPIPRTYALGIYGDIDISNIKTKPVGRRDIITYFKKNSEIYDVLEMMKKEIDKGHQIYVIAPSIIDSDEKAIDNVVKLEDKMNLAFGKISKIGSVHGKMLSQDKEKVMQKFECGDINILISTTVIEVGVNVPNASMIVIFNANNFGLSTLHQLRGRVGRGNIQSYCILLSEKPSDRLKMLEKCNDGFEISEYDFVTRGEGDLFGIRQSGDIDFKLVNVKRDYDFLLRVKKDVEEFTEKCQSYDMWYKVGKSLNIIDD